MTETLLRSRQEARQADHKRYVGSSCSKCGNCERYVSGHCVSCSRAASLKRRNVNPERYNEYAIRWRLANPEKVREYALKWKAANPERVSANKRKWDAANPEKVDKQRRKSHYKKYGLTIEQYDALLALQHDVCAICAKACSSGMRLAVDHSHACCPGKKSCGKCFRGLLCGNCNNLLGRAKDDPIVLLAASSYLDFHANANG